MKNLLALIVFVYHEWGILDGQRNCDGPKFCAIFAKITKFQDDKKAKPFKGKHLSTAYVRRSIRSAIQYAHIQKKQQQKTQKLLVSYSSCHFQHA